MIEGVKEASSLLDCRAYRHQIVVETNRLGIIRPVDDYTLLQKLKARQRSAALQSSVVDEYIAAFAQYAYHTDKAWREVFENRTELSSLTELLVRDSTQPLTLEESIRIRGVFSKTPQMRPPRAQPQRPVEEPSAPSTQERSNDVQREGETGFTPTPNIRDDPQHIEEQNVRDKTAQASLLDKAVMNVVRPALSIVHEEYKRAATYFAHRGAQTRSSNYGGSRSHTYMQMLKSAQTLSELRKAREEFHKRHLKPESAHDEYGGLLRIAGRRLAWVPYLGSYLEQKVREDDKAMKEADFVYPGGITRYYARDDGSIVKSTDKQE